MSDFDDYPMVPGGEGGSLAPLSPSPPLAPSPAEFGAPDWWVPSSGEPVSSSPGGVGGIFGFKVEGIGIRELQTQFVEPVAGLFRQEMQSRGVNRRYIDLAANWFVNNCQRPPRYEMKTHEYSLNGFQITHEDKISLTCFLNACDDAGVPADTVRLFLSWYWVQLPRVIEQWAQQNQSPSLSTGGSASLGNLSDADFKFVMKSQAKHQQKTKDQLRTLWGNSFNHRMQVAAGYFNSLPEADRDYFESTVCKGGIVFGDTVEAIKYMYEQGVAQAKPVVKVDNLAGEIEAIEHIMRTDRARYNKDIALQERLRALYELRN